MSADNMNNRLWQLINKGTCTFQNKNNIIKIKNSSKITTDPQQIQISSMHSLLINFRL
jgi:hypothetical protein